MADLEALPAHMKGELIDGVLYAMTRPRAPHQELAGMFSETLRAPYRWGRGGPGGWWILQEPGLELPGAPEISPDIAAWRRERLPSLPHDHPITVVPEWVCEILSPATRRYDLTVKRPYYARVGVSHLWLIDGDALLLTASRLESGRWVELGTYADETEARVEPFDATPINLRAWWDAIADAQRA